MDGGDEELLGRLAPFVAEPQRASVAVLVTMLDAGRRIEAWLSATLADEDLDTSEFTALVALLVREPPGRLTAGEIASAIVQTTGGTTKTIQRLEGRGLVARVSDPSDRRRTLIELTEAGHGSATAALELVLGAFELEIGGIDEAEVDGLGAGLQRLSLELGLRLGHR